MQLNDITKKIILIVVPVLVGLAVLLGLYQWQYNNQTFRQSDLHSESNHDSLEDYWNTAQQLAPDNSNTTVSFYAVGDIMLSRTVASRIAQNDYDSYWPFRNVETELYSTDFNFANLESPFSGNDSYNPSEGLVFNAPTWTLPGLARFNFKVLSLANNHALDQDVAGLLNTKNLLLQNNLNPIGAGQNLDEAWQGQVYSVKGLRIGFVAASYTSYNDGGVKDSSHIARIEHTNRLAQSIAELKTKSDFIIVAMHAGTEYTHQPNQAQIEFAHTAIGSGADMVIGHHPHWIQTIEQYQGKYIFYSLGNFVFDQMWSQNTREGLMLKIELEKLGSCAIHPQLSPRHQQQVACSDAIQGNNIPATLKQIQLQPIIIENYDQPRLATEAEAGVILKKIGVTTNVITP